MLVCFFVRRCFGRLSITRCPCALLCSCVPSLRPLDDDARLVPTPHTQTHEHEHSHTLATHTWAIKPKNGCRHHERASGGASSCSRTVSTIASNCERWTWVYAMWESSSKVVARIEPERTQLCVVALWNCTLVFWFFNLPFRFVCYRHRARALSTLV